MPTITTKDGVEIFFKDWGSGQPIVFSHGWPLSADDWDAQMMFFVTRGYRVVAPLDDDRRDYRVIVDASGDANLLDQLIARSAHGGQIVLAGFYSAPLSFSYPPAFMREASIRVAAEWRHADLLAVRHLIDTGRLSLDGLITHHARAASAEAAYRTAFDDPTCLKMVLDWRAAA